MTVCVVIFAVAAVTLLCAAFIQRNEYRKSDQLLLMLCETGERNLDYYFNSVQKSLESVAAFVETDLEGLEREQLERHVNSVRTYFAEMASKTNGVLTYYYRIDPNVSSSVTGFWYADLDGEGFKEQATTDISDYDTTDTSQLVWFTVPKQTGRPIWLPPYITESLNIRVISYNVPIMFRGQFVGVVGIELDYSEMAEQVDSIRLYDNGYAFLNDATGRLFYHPRIDVTELAPDEMPRTPEGAISDSTFMRYTFDGVEKEAAWLSLSNGMRLNVCAPVSEMEGDWQRLVWNILILASVVLVVSSLFVMYYCKRITTPIEQLIVAAEQVDDGNYDFALEYEQADEVGRLTNTFRRLANHMHESISDLNRQVYVDPLTRVKSKAAYSIAIDELQAQIESSETEVEFAIGVFDCDNLKFINDQYGHDKGDVYLQSASRLICHVFRHSPVFRIGGDEFAAILQGADYQHREALIDKFARDAEETNAAVANDWEQVHVSMGLATYDQEEDSAVIDIVRAADKAMYENKRERKGRGQTRESGR